METGGIKNPGPRFSNERSRFLEFHWTSDTPNGTVALSNHAYGLYGTFISLGGICNIQKSASMATGGRKIPGARFYEKDVLIFLKNHRTSDTHTGTLAQSNRANGLYKTFSTRAVFERSIRALGWQLGTANFRDHNFPKKTSWLY